MMQGTGRKQGATAMIELVGEDDHHRDMMMQSTQYGGIFQEEQDSEDQESHVGRIVYEDLDDGARRSKALLAATGRRPPVNKTKKQQETRILERPKELFAHHSVFAGDVLNEDDGDEENEDEASNPFASLLQPAPPEKATATPTTTNTSRLRRASLSPPSPPSPASLPSPEPPRRSPPPPLYPPRVAKPTTVASTASVRKIRPSLPSSTILNPSKPNRRSSAPIARPPPRSLAPTFEAADARPSRWTRTAPVATMTTTNKRRQSSVASATALSRQQQADAKRRKSLPASLSSLDSDRQPTGRRLSDVLQKATVLSQQRTDVGGSASAMTSDQRLAYTESTRETDDNIADTVHEMRDEPFHTQFFSPSKLRNGASSSHRRPRADAVLAKIRGRIGDAIRKATRKTNRDLTLLRSQGQTLLGGDLDSAGEVHRRDFVVVRIEKTTPRSAMQLTFNATVEETSSTPREPAAETAETATSTVPATRGLKLTVVFAPQDTATLAPQLGKDTRVKFFAPFQILREGFVPGRRRRKRKFLVGTSLFEVLTSDHDE